MFDSLLKTSLLSILSTLVVVAEPEPDAEAAAVDA